MPSAMRLALMISAFVFAGGLLMMLLAHPENLGIGEMPKQFGFGVLLAGLGLAVMLVTAVLAVARRILSSRNRTTENEAMAPKSQR